MITELRDLLEVGELSDDFETRTGRSSIFTHTISAGLAARIFREFAQLRDTNDMLTELLSQGDNIKDPWEGLLS